MSPHLAGWLMIAVGSSIALGVGVLLADRRRREREAEQMWTTEDRRWLESASIATDAGERP